MAFAPLLGLLAEFRAAHKGKSTNGRRRRPGTRCLRRPVPEVVERSAWLLDRRNLLDTIEIAHDVSPFSRNTGCYQSLVQ